MSCGKLFLFCGLPGTGKTTLAKKLEKEKPIVRFCPDEWVYDLLADKTNIPEMDRIREIVESRQWIQAKKLLQLGNTVLLENGFWSIEERERYRTEAKNIGAEVTIYLFKADLELLKHRLAKRNAEEPKGVFNISMENIEKWYSEFEVPSLEELKHYDSYKIIENKNE